MEPWKRPDEPDASDASDRFNDSTVNADHPAPPEVTQLLVTGMTCNNCARHVTEAIQSVGGVTSATVSLESNRATVRWRADAAPSAVAVVQAVKAAGYEARWIDGRGSKLDGPKRWSPLDGWRFNVVVGLACTAPLMMGEWIAKPTGNEESS